jgi:hypothetical protein
MKSKKNIEKSLNFMPNYNFYNLINNNNKGYGFIFVVAFRF